MCDLYTYIVRLTSRYNNNNILVIYGLFVRGQLTAAVPPISSRLNRYTRTALIYYITHEYNTTIVVVNPYIYICTIIHNIL